MATSLSVSVPSSRQMVLVEEDGEISSSDKSSLLLAGYNLSNCVVVSAVHSGSWWSVSVDMSPICV